MRHLFWRYFTPLAANAALTIVLAACATSVPEGTPLSLVSPSAIPPTVLATNDPTESVPEAMPTEECTEKIGSLQEGVYRGVAVAMDVPYSIYLPPCYDEQVQPYPTLYLLHGYPYDQTHWQALGAIEAADKGIGDGEWPPFIMVMPLQPEPLYRGSDGGPGSYESEILDGLVPFIESHYRSNRSVKALAGISRGGVWALEIGLRNPHLFGAVAALSPALAVNSARPLYDPFEIVMNSARFPSSILLMAGDEDWAAVETERLSNALSDVGAEHVFQISPGDHSDATWAAVMSEVLGFLALRAGP